MYLLGIVKNYLQRLFTAGRYVQCGCCFTFPSERRAVDLGHRYLCEECQSVLGDIAKV